MEEKKKRLNEVYQYLRSTGRVHTQKDMAEAMKISRPNLSSALNGNPTFLTDGLLTRVVSFFPEISLTWLMDGRGTMLIDDYKPKEPGVRTYGVDDLLAVKDEVIEQLKARLEEVTTSKDEIIRLLKEQNELLKRDEITLSTGQWAAEERSRD